VIGGLCFATCATLFLVPTLFSLAHARDRRAADASAPANPSHLEPLGATDVH
jgi:hypothetical protein